ncbi:MAG: glycosyltransferase [Fusobacteriaceae bacterium]
MKELSIIIPAYNAAKYIQKCLDSVLEIEEIDLEIIVINDGSKDETLKIIKQYEIKNNNLKVIDKKNEGVSAARNLGLKVAQGKFIVFIDSDDFINATIFKKCFEMIRKSNLDILVTEALEIDENGKILKIRNKHESILRLNTISGKEMMKNLVQKKCLSVEAWLNIYRKDFLVKNNLLFKDYFYEDSIYTQECLYHAEKIKCVNEKFYRYVRRDNTITTSNDNVINEKRIHSVKSLILDLIKFNKTNKLISKEWNYLIISNYYNYIFFLKQKRDFSIEKDIKLINLTLKDKLKYLKIYFKGRK